VLRAADLLSMVGAVDRHHRLSGEPAVRRLVLPRASAQGRGGGTAACRASACRAGSGRLAWCGDRPPAANRSGSARAAQLSGSTDPRPSSIVRSMPRLQDKIVLISGAAGAIGQAVAAAVGREGGRAVTTDLGARTGIDHALD